MPAIVTDQFRILNASNFIDSIENSNNSYYVFLGLPNPATVGFGRTTNWDVNTPDPVDSINTIHHYQDTMIFGKKIVLHPEHVWSDLLPLVQRCINSSFHSALGTSPSRILFSNFSIPFKKSETSICKLYAILSPYYFYFISYPRN